MPSRDVDSGWAWVVLGASYFNQLVTAGLAFVAGMFQVIFLEEFHGSVALTSWVTGLFSSLLQLAGPMASVMSNTFGCRTSVILGGCLLASGFLLSGLGNSLEWLMVTFGAVAGLGMGLTYIPSIVVINFYFDKRRTLVNGIASSAGGLGIVLAPQVSRFLFDHFSWRESLFILAGVSAHICIAGALMFPVHEKPKVKTVLCCANENTKERYNVEESRALSSSNDKHDERMRKEKVLDIKSEMEVSDKFDDNVIISETKSNHSDRMKILGINDKRSVVNNSTREAPSNNGAEMNADNGNSVGDEGNNSTSSTNEENFVEIPLQEVCPTSNIPNSAFPRNDLPAMKEDSSKNRTSKIDSGISKQSDDESNCGSKTNVSNNPSVSSSHNLYTTLSKSDNDADDDDGDDNDINGKKNVKSGSIHSNHDDHATDDNAVRINDGIGFNYIKIESGKDDDNNTNEEKKENNGSIYSKIKIDKGDDDVGLVIKYSVNGDDENIFGVDDSIQLDRKDSLASQSPLHLMDTYPPLYRNGRFLILCLSLVVSSAGSGGFLIHVPSFLKSRGLSGQEVTNILSINGVAILIGRCMVGALVNNQKGNEALFLIAMQIIGGVFMLLYPIIGTSYASCMGNMFAVGAYCGTFYSLLPTLTIVYVGLSGLSTAFGIEMVCSGIGYLVAPPLAGMVVDLTGNYEYNMYGGGVMFILAGSICMLLPILSMGKTRRTESTTSPSSLS